MTQSEDTDTLSQRDIIYRLQSQSQRLLRLLQGVNPGPGSGDQCVTIVEAYSREMLEAAACQVLEGMPISDGHVLECDQCGESLQVGDDIQVQAHRMIGTLPWFMEEFACADCDLELSPYDESLDVIALAQIHVRGETPDQTTDIMLGSVSISESSGHQYADDIFHPEELV